MKNIVLSVCEDFKIKLEQVYTVTTDNGANMLKAVKVITNDYGESEIIECDEEEYDDKSIEEDSDTDSDEENLASFNKEDKDETDLLPEESQYAEHNNPVADLNIDFDNVDIHTAFHAQGEGDTLKVTGICFVFLYFTNVLFLLVSVVTFKIHD